jgi:hypothetical protein
MSYQLDPAVSQKWQDDAADAATMLRMLQQEMMQQEMDQQLKDFQPWC